MKFPFVYREEHGHPYYQKLCRLLAEGHGPGPHNVLVEFEDGFRLVTIKKAKSLRTARRRDLQLGLF